MSGKKGMKHNPLALKLEAIRLYQEAGKSQKEIAELLGLRRADRIKKWLTADRREGLKAFEKNRNGIRRGRPAKRENTEAYIARLEMENDLLKNSMPNCASRRSPNARSAHLPSKRKIRSKGDV